MISCEKAAIICNKTQYREATFFEKVKLRFHLLVCRTCSKFSKKNTHFTSLCDQANLQSLSNKDKELMKNKLEIKDR
ncbi:hypothetical protein B0O79_2702 [Flavobacteriaceae bacterium MAR_2009_75]|nr:hypothetical protein B0O79_2702 [Flavobacteriaceae bacterium MAR_2009_75]